MFSPEEQKRICGTLTIQNVSGGPVILTSYNNLSVAAGVSIDLLDVSAPAEIRMEDYTIARGCVGWASVGTQPRHAEFELAQKIVSGELAITIDLKPETSLLRKLYKR